jgi:hypothetical protein
MYINQIDELFDNIIDKFYIYCEKKSIFKTFSKDTNFVKYQKDIISFIEKFYKSIDQTNITKMIEKKNISFILNIIKRYCAFYIFLGIAYYYNGDRDLFITNLVEFSRDQKMSTFQIDNFFNSDNNYKIIKFFSIIKQINKLQEFKSIDRIKIILKNKPVIYKDTIEFFEELGEDFIVKNFIIKNNFHNLVKTIIFRKIYINEEKESLIDILNEKDKKDAIYKYIQVVVSNKDKIVDFNVLHKYFSLEKNPKLAEEFYSYIDNEKNKNTAYKKKSEKFVDFLFSFKKLIPITDDFLRFHKSSEKYTTQDQDRESTKIKYIINKTNKVINYYSEIYKKNAKMKLEVDNEIMFKQMKDRNVLIYNDNEEVKIINKLELSDQTSDLDLLVDLENIRKYPYINYKDFQKYGIRIRPSNTIKSIRHTNLQSNNKKQFIETRIGNKDIPLNVIGVVYNPHNLPLDCYRVENLVNVKKLYSSENGFLSFIKLMQDSENKSKKSLYYWLFDLEKDTVKINKYLNVSSLDNQKNITIMLQQVYENLKSIMTERFIKNLKKNDDLSLWFVKKQMNYFKKNYINLELDNNLKNYIYNYSINSIKEIKIVEDDVDNIIPGKSNKLIKLPKALKIKDDKNIIIVQKEKKEDIVINDDKNIPICLHYIKWGKIKSMKSNNETKNQAIYDFVKHYVKQNKRGDYICKSCNEEISNLKRYVYEGTYIKELDTFMTTSLAVNQNLKDIPKYSKYTRTIRNIEKNVEKICYSLGFNNYLGSTPINKLHRKLLVKDTIDLILIHTDYIKEHSKDRAIKAQQKYNINKDFTRLFFFPLKDDIFLTSSEDIDKFKILKFNNVITYILFILLSEIKPGQIISMKNDKFCNYFIYSKVGSNIMKDLYIRYSEKDKMKLEKLPLLSYLIFNFSCIATNNHLWLWSNKNNKKGYNFIVQKIIINTFVDLINSIMEASFKKNKNFLYEIISTRFKTKIDKILSDNKILEMIKISSMEKIKVDKETKKIKFVTKKYIDINLDQSKASKFFKSNKYNKECETLIKRLSYREIIKYNKKIDILSNCPSGKFHNWVFKDNDLVCSICNQKYNQLIKKLNTTTEKENNDILDNIRYNFINKLTKTYCLDGNVHDIDPDTNKCKLCKINPLTFKYTRKDLITLEKNLSIKKNNKLLEQIKKGKDLTDSINKRKKDYNIVMKKFNEDYENDTNNNIENYVTDFCDKLTKILGGNKIKVKNKDIYIKEKIFKITNNQYGNEAKPIFIKKSEDKIIFEENHPFFKRDVLYFKNKIKRISVYYDAITKQYIGFAENYKKFMKNESYKALDVIYSVKDMILLLGFDNDYTNIYDIDSKLKEEDRKDIKKNELVEKIIRNRNKNIKFLISLIRRIIYSIKYSYKNFGLYNFKQKEIINEFNKILKNFKDEKNDLKFFENDNIIVENIKINPIPKEINFDMTKNYMKNNIINKLNNSDSKLIYYLVKNLDKLIDINSQPAIKSNISYLIIKILKYSFDHFHIPLQNTKLRKFMTIINTNNPDVDNTYITKGIYQEIFKSQEIDDNNTVKQEGIYNELLTNDEINSEERMERNLDAKEAFDSLDIDDYGSGDERDQDDIDYSAQAFN